ncbi:MAG: AAA family ATPase, partial [Armatimonadetes bacterium]|nr:AAA family ATPase [Armatimonadota bacterium]
HAPCLGFIDELDAVGRRRRDGPGGVSGEREQTLNQLLVEMDGFDPGAGVVVMAATNRPDVLDPALLRPGRFDRRIVLDLPDRAGRRAIFAVHLRDKPVAADVDLDVLARQTVGFSGADIASVANEAALLAARRGRMDLSMTEIEEAIDRQLAGPPRRTRRPGEHARSVTAYHVAGHALAAVLLPHAAPPRRVSMLPRSDGEEHAWYAPDEERCTATRSELLDQVAVLLAGRAAETLVFGEATTGGAGDLETATETARRMVVEYGMSARLGPLALRSRRHPFPLGGDAVEGRGYSEAVAAEVDREIRCIVQERIAAVTTLLQRHRRDLERVAQSLLECETLTGADLLVLLAGECDAEAREGVLPVASAHA